MATDYVIAIHRHHDVGAMMRFSLRTLYALTLAGIISLGAACAGPDLPGSSASAPDSVALSPLSPYMPSRFTCPECRIVPGAPLDLGEGVSAPHRLANIIKRDRHGRYWVSRTYEEGIVGIYDSAGHFLTTIGKSGDGPGEMRFVSGMSEGQSGMYLSDSRTQRLNVFDDSLRHVASYPLKHSIRAFELLPNHQMVAWFHVRFGPTPASIHLMSDSGRYVSALIPEHGYNSELDEMLNGDYVIATTRNGDIVIGNAGSYTLTVVREGDIARVLTSPVEWFESYARYTNDNPIPIARMTSIAVDDHNRAWVLFNVPDPAYQPAPFKKDSEGMVPIAVLNEQYNSAIEVWDLETGALLTGILVPPFLQRFAGDQHTYSFIETPSGEVRARVWGLGFEHAINSKEQSR